ncbi:MAG TPA: TPM domain-containing protein [Candidatus Tumulicola sp.]|jgi:uncharacterized protein
MKPFTAIAFPALLVALLAPLPAAARAYVQDGARMFSPSQIEVVDQRIATFNGATGKEVVVVTVPSLNGASLQDAAAKVFSEQAVNGVLIFIARDDRKDIIVPDRSGSQAGWFTPEVLRSIRAQMEREFHTEAFDSGLLYGVDGVLAVYGQHLQAQAAANMRARIPSKALATANAPIGGGLHISMFWWIVIIVVGFLILRSVMRAFSAPRYGAPGMPPGPVPPGGVPPAGGYGPGYGYGGGGGSFWSGLLGGLGGAWLGNEMFGRGGGAAAGPADAAQSGGGDAGGSWGAGSSDSGGLQSDAGQADMGGSSGGDWSGGGFGGDFGGGGDGGGGGGDSGGGW